MERIAQKLKDAQAELMTAANQLPQDGPYNHIKYAEVHIQSVIADLEALPDLEARSLAVVRVTTEQLEAANAALAKQAEEIGALQERLAVPISEAVAASAPVADTTAFAPVL